METRPLLFLSLLFIALIPYVAKANPDTHTLEVTTDKPVYYEKGETMQINAFSNESIDVTLNVYWNWRNLNDNELIYRNTKTANATWNLPTDNQKVGFYKIVVNSSETTVTTWRTLISFSDYTSETLPFSHVWKGINYSLIGRNFIAEKQGDFIEIQYPKIPFEHSTSFYRNNMSFLVRLNAVSWSVDLCYMTVHSGLKWIVNGTLNNPVTFEFECSHNPLKQWKKRLDSFSSSGNLVFDWSDLRKAGKAFTWNQTSKTLSVDIPDSFSLDPAIFEDGFESNDFSAWTGTTGSPSVVSTYPHCGTYHLSANTHAHYVYKTFTSEAITYARGYFNFSAVPVGSGDAIIPLLLSNNNNWQTYLGVTMEWNGSYAVWGLYCGEVDSTVLSDTIISADIYYCVEIERDVTNNEQRLWIDDVEIISRTETLTVNSDRLHFGIHHLASMSCALYGDCAVIDTSYIGCEAEEGQDLTFTQFENLLFHSSNLMLKELGFSHYENIRFHSSSLMLKEFGFLLFETLKFYGSSSLGKELGFLLGETIRFHSSIISSFEGVALDLTFILFETVSFVASRIADLSEVAVVVTELDVGSLAGLALIIAVIALALVLVYKKQ